MADAQTAQQHNIIVAVSEIDTPKISNSLFHTSEVYPDNVHDDKPGINITDPTADFPNITPNATDGSEPVSNTIPGDISTTATIEVGQSIVDTIDFAGDQDWFAVNLIAGEQYEIDLIANETTFDPYVELMDANGLQLAYNDDGGAGLNSHLFFTAETSGTHYINARGFSSSAGEYTLSIEASEPITERTVDEIAHFLTHEFRAAQRWGTLEVAYDISTISAEHQLFARTALEAWADISGLTFVEVTGSADITFQNTANGAYAQNFTSGQDADGFHVITSATINVATNWSSNSYGDDPLDNYIYQTFIHEVGHAIGLGHAGPYNGSATYSATGLGDNVYLNDSWAFTVMSYFTQAVSGYGDYRYVLGPQMADINAVQDLYGTNPDGTNTGNTTYGFNSTEDGIEDWSTFTYTTASGELGRTPSMTIYDTGGIDTIDLSGYNANQTLYMNPGTFSDLGDRTFDGSDNYEFVVAIDESTMIENAVLGNGNDTAYGNSANNIINGGLGGDALYGDEGDDQLIVDFGHDLLEGGEGNDTFTMLSTAQGMTISDFTIGEDVVDLRAFSRASVIDAFNNRSSQLWATEMYVEGIFISLDGNLTEQLSLSDFLLADPQPTPELNEIHATSALEYLQGTDEADAFIFSLDTSTIALGADRIVNWHPGDVIDVSALGISEGDLELIQDGNRVRLRQTDGSDDFHALIFNGTHTIEEISAAIIYGDTTPPPPTNINPTATDDEATTEETTPVTIDALANDSDADGDPLSISAYGQASNGTVTQLANGQLQYTANQDFTGTDTFTYTISDGNGGSDQGEVTITVEEAGAPPPPPPPPPPPSEYNEIIATSTLEYLRGTAADDAFIFGAGTSTISLGADRILDWQPGDVIDVSALGFSEGDLELVQSGNRLRLRQTDGSDDFHAFIFNGEHSIEEVYAALVYDGTTPPPPPTNTNPVATDDTAITEETTPIAIDVLANDTDADGDTLSVSEFGQASNGTVTVLENGQLQYVANEDFIGTDTFTYTVSDGNGGSDVGEVTITVEEADIPPPPPSEYNEIIATSTLEYLRGTAADDAFIFGADTSTISLGADRILDWQPGDILDVSALGFSEGELELIQSGNRLRLRQTDGSDDFHAFIFNGEHSMEDVYAAIVYTDSASAEAISKVDAAILDPVSEPETDPFITVFEAPQIEHSKAIVSEVMSTTDQLDEDVTVFQIEDGWALG